MAFFLVGLLAASSLAQELHLFNFTKPIDGLSSTCTQVLNQGIACDPYLLKVKQDSWADDKTLNSVCTSGCSTAWTNYLRRVNGACGTQRYNGGNGQLYLPAVNIEAVYEQYQLFCLKNSAGKFCNAVIRDILGVNSGTQGPKSTKAPAIASSAICDGCFLSSIAQMLQMPLSSASDYATALSSLQASCHTTIKVTSPAKTSWAIPASTTPALPGCKGTKYDIKSGDTCQSISMAQGFSTTQLLVANGLTAYCRNFPSKGSLCLPDALKCRPYRPKSTDTCNSIAGDNQISVTQLVSWNPELGSFCGGLDKVVNKTMAICLSTPGGPWVNPSPIATTSTTTTSQVDTRFTEPVTPFSQFTGGATSMPAGTTSLPDIIGGSGYVTPFAEGTRLDCDLYSSPPVLLDGNNRTFSYVCEDVARAYGVSTTDLLAWNPGVNRTGGVEYPCELMGGFQYCVQLVPYVPGDTTQNCSSKALADPGYGCDYFAAQHNITKAAVAAWNPSTGTNCQSFKSGTTYCAAVQHFVSPDTASNCAHWAMADSSVPSTCATLEGKYKLSHARFVAWNPSVLNDCSGAVAGYDYCVGIPSFHPGFPS